MALPLLKVYNRPIRGQLKSPLVPTKANKETPMSISLCTVDGCDKKHRAKGYCNMHWQRQYHHNSLIPLRVMGKGMRKNKLYWVHRSMLQRCNDSNCPSYKHYGGRGITVCDRWSGKNGFSNFIEDMGERPEGMSIDRIDNEKGYSPDNCRWATWVDQARNKRNNRRYTAHGKTMLISEWAKELGIKRSTLIGRIRDGWTEEEALSDGVHLSTDRKPRRHPQEYERTSHCVNGHEKTPDNVYILKNRPTGACRVCRSDSRLKWRRLNNKLYKKEV